MRLTCLLSTLPGTGVEIPVGKYVTIDNSADKDHAVFANKIDPQVQIRPPKFEVKDIGLTTSLMWGPKAQINLGLPNFKSGKENDFGLAAGFRVDMLKYDFAFKERESMF